MSKKDKLYEYLDSIKYAKLDGRAKGLLYFYATVYNWTERRPSYYSERTICALTGMAPSTYQEKRKYLEKFGWIVVKGRGREVTSLVGVLVGRGDPDYESNCWAKWHPYNIQEELKNFWEEFPSLEDALDNDADLVLKMSSTYSREHEDIWGKFEHR